MRPTKDWIGRLAICGIEVCKYELVMTSDHGVPQGRERLYVLGVRRDSLRQDMNFDDIFPAKLQQHAVALEQTN